MGCGFDDQFVDCGRRRQPRLKGATHRGIGNIDHSEANPFAPGTVGGSKRGLEPTDGVVQAILESEVLLPQLTRPGVAEKIVAVVEQQHPGVVNVCPAPLHHEPRRAQRGIERGRQAECRNVSVQKAPDTTEPERRDQIVPSGESVVQRTTRSAEVLRHRRHGCGRGPGLRDEFARCVEDVVGREACGAGHVLEDSLYNAAWRGVGLAG